MKKITVLILILTVCFNLNAQEVKTKKELRVERKLQETEERDDRRVIQEQWANDQTFVLEAQRVSTKVGESYDLSSATNFVYVNGDKASIQLAFDHLVGWNGLAGITVSGRITKYEFDSENKNKPILIKMSIQGSSGFQDISLWISSSGRGEAQITDIKGNRLQFTGDIVSIEDSRVFVGNERF